MTIKTSDIERIVTILSAYAVIGLGLLVMAGWHMKCAVIVQFLPGLVPMQYNTALVFVLCGLALAMAEIRQPVLAAVCAAAVLALSSLIGLQYIIKADFGIDRLLMDPAVFTQIKTSFPGRMAPNTVIYFLFFSVSILCFLFVRKQERSFNIAVFSGVTILLLSFIVIAGYLAGVEAAYSWWGLSDMAPQTAAAFFLIGIGLLGLARIISVQIDKNAARLWLPAYVALVGIIITILITQGILSYNKEYTGDAAMFEAKRAVALINSALNRDMNTIRHMQRRHGAYGVNDWKDEARSLIMDNPAYYSLAVIGNGYKIFEAIPDGSFWQELHFDRNMLETGAARKNGYSAGLVRMSGRPALTVFFIPFPDHGRDGENFFAVAYDFEKALQDALALNAASGFSYEIRDDSGALIFPAESGTKAAFPWEITRTGEFSFLGKTWSIRVRPDIQKQQSDGLILLIIISGFGLSLLLSYVMWQSNRLRKSEERYSTAIQGSLAALWDWDFEKGTVFWGGYAAELWGARSIDEIPATRDGVLATINPDDREEIDRTLMRHIEKNKSFSIEYRQMTMDGREIWVQSRGKVTRFRAEQPVSMSGTLIDITERKLAEVEIRRSNKELEQFAYVASHDLKAPLRGIDNLAKWVEEDMEGIITEDAREKLKLLRQRVGRLERLLEDILRYSRAGRVADNPEIINTGELVQQIADALITDGKFTVTIASGMPVLMSPRTPLEQVFSNIIANAVKHHDLGSGNIRVEAADQGLYYEFRVRDDGPGIPPEFHDKVFQMFQTLQSRDTKEGSGLGMAIVRKLVEWRGGKAWIISEPGMRGSEIRFLWPKDWDNCSTCRVAD